MKKSDTFILRMEPEDRILLRWISDSTCLSMAEIMRIGMRHLALTASGSGPDRPLSIDSPDRLKELALDELTRQIESDWLAHKTTLIASALDEHGRYKGQ